MKSWTGYTGEKDAALRQSGQTFLLGFHSGDEGIAQAAPEVLPLNQVMAGDYEEYVNIAAPDLGTALENYEPAFNQWRDAENNGGEA